MGAAITLVGTKIYGYVSYSVFPNSPIFLVRSFPRSYFLKKSLQVILMAFFSSPLAQMVKPLLVVVVRAAISNCGIWKLENKSVLSGGILMATEETPSECPPEHMY